jgi:glycosyltransferase involved in cell wall biosynthesis
MPIFNERAFLRRIVDQVLAAPLPASCALEIVMVDDASSDGSAALAAELASEHPGRIRLFRQTHNQGKGAAIARAIQEMRGDIAIFQDADLEYDPRDYPRLLEPILAGRADVVYGSRFLSTSSRRVLNYHHTLGNHLLTHLSNLATGLNLTDMETCYKAFRADVLRTIPIRSRRFGIEPEITAKIAKRNCTVFEVPIAYYGRTYLEGKKITWRDGIEALGVIAKHWVIDDCFEERYGQAVLHSLSAARRFTSWSVQVIEPWLGQRILEIGSGLANISRQLPKREHLTLSDRDAEYLKLLRQGFEHFDMVDVVELDLERDEHFERVERRYDSIVCLNVLEHIADDRAALARMARLLAPGGRLILQVPQYQLLFSEMDRELGHQRRYDADELADKLAGAGLEVEGVQSFNALGTLGWLINARLLGRRNLSKVQLKVYDLLVPLMSRLERVLKLPGLSLIGVGKKAESAY